jgi:ribonuclease Z
MAQIQTAFCDEHPHSARSRGTPASKVETLFRPQKSAEGVVYQNSGVTVTAFPAEHHPVKPAYGKRIDYADHSVVFSGDTTRSDNLIKSAKCTDVLIHEVILPPPGAGQNPITQYHTTPEQAADVFTRVTPRLAVYPHVVGSDGTAMNRIIRTRAAGYSGRLEVSQDFMSIDISGRLQFTLPFRCKPDDPCHHRRGLWQRYPIRRNDHRAGKQFFGGRW